MSKVKRTPEDSALQHQLWPKQRERNETMQLGDNTIYQRNPDAWAKIERAGFASLTEMARRMTSASIMDDALGYRSATSKWSRGERMPGLDTELRARAYLNGTRIPHAGSHTGKPDNIGGALYLVACPPGTAAKVEKVLGVLGCDVTEV